MHGFLGPRALRFDSFFGLSPDKAHSTLGNMDESFVCPLFVEDSGYEERGLDWGAPHPQPETRRERRILD